MIRRVSCASCGAPYDKPDDDPDLSHPSCAPADRERFEAATHGFRTYRGVMAAIHHSLCRGCGSRIEVGATQVLADIDGRRVWACVQCAATAPETAPDRPESDAIVVPRPRTSPDESGATQGAEPTRAPRRAAA